MRIFPIPAASRLDHRGAPDRRSRPARRFVLEPLEARTALSSGLQAAPAAVGSYAAEAVPAVVGSVAAAWTAREAAALAVPVTFPGADAAPTTGSAGMWEAADVPLLTETYANLVPVVSEWLAGLAGSIAVLGQAYRDGVPTSELLAATASAIGATPAEIPLDVIPLGVAAAATAQQAGIALPATVAGLEELAGGSQAEGWISTAVGRVEALADSVGSIAPSQAGVYGPPSMAQAFGGNIGLVINAEGSVGEPGPPGEDPNAPPAPPLLVSLGKFIFRNLDVLYSNYITYFDNTSTLTTSLPDDIAPSGLASVSDATATVPEAQDVGWAGAAGMSYLMAGGRGPAVTQEPASRSGEVLGPDSSDLEPAPPASITAGEVPLDILLSDPGSSAEGVSIGLQQVAELTPDGDSSLALVATLWTLPSNPRAEPADGDDLSGERAEPARSSASPPPWAVFVIGLDEAIERSRDDCGTALSDGGHPGESDWAADAAGARLEWRCPIIPAARGMRRAGRADEASLAAGTAAIEQGAACPGADFSRSLPSRAAGDQAPAPRPSPDGVAPHDAVAGRTLTEGVVRSAWAASASAVVAGWLWARRQRGKLGSTGRRDRPRGAAGHSEDEGR